MRAGTCGDDDGDRGRYADCQGNDRDVVDLRCYPVNEPEPGQLTTHSWWWWLACGIFLANLLPLDSQLTQAAQVIAGATVILPAAMTLVRWWNAKTAGTPA
jgi:hypothetical protein